MLVGGVFHAGVEIYGIEWCYGYAPPGYMGVSHLAPRTHPQHSYRTTVPLGRTQLSDEEVKTVVARYAQTWPGSEYHIIHHNCLNFCNALCQELGVRRIPGWVDRVTRAASFVDQTSKNAMEGLGNTVELARNITIDLQDLAENGFEQADSENIVVDTVHTVRRESARAIETARAKTDEAMEAVVNVDIAQNMQEISDAAVALPELVWARTQEIGEGAQEVLGEASETAQAIGEKVQEGSQIVAERAQELAQGLLGQEQFSRAQDLASEAHGRASVHAQEIGGHARNIWGWGSGFRRAAREAMGRDPDPYGNDRQQGSRDPWGVLPPAASRSVGGIDPPAPGYLKSEAPAAPAKAKVVVADDDQE